MYSDRFETGVARLRHRFAATLEGKINSTVMSAERMTRGNDAVVRLVSESYRHLHSICGVGATAGFPTTGEAAHVAEATLMQAYNEERGLNESEVRSLKRALEALRKAAAAGLRSMRQRGG